MKQYLIHTAYLQVPAAGGALVYVRLDYHEVELFQPQMQDVTVHNDCGCTVLAGIASLRDLTVLS